MQNIVQHHPNKNILPIVRVKNAVQQAKKSCLYSPEMKKVNIEPVSAQQVLAYTTKLPQKLKPINHKQQGILSSLIPQDLFIKNGSKLTFEQKVQIAIEKEFETEPHFEEMNINNCSLVLKEYDEYKIELKKQIAELDEKPLTDLITSKYDKNIYFEKSILDTAKKDFQLFKLVLSRTMLKGLQTKDYAFYTTPITSDLAVKILDKYCNDKKTKSFDKIYRNVVMQQQYENFGKLGIKTEEKRDESGKLLATLITIPKTQQDNPMFEKRINVLQTYSCKTWCTHTKAADTYLQNGDFVIYKPQTQELADNSLNISFVYTNDKIQQIQNFKNNNSENSLRIRYLNMYKKAINTFPHLAKDFSKTLKKSYIDISNLKIDLAEELQYFKLKDYKLEGIISLMFNFNETFIESNEPYFQKKLIEAKMSYLEYLETTQKEYLPSFIFSLNKIFENFDNKEIQNKIYNINLWGLEFLKNKLYKYWPQNIHSINNFFANSQDADVQKQLYDLNTNFLKEVKKTKRFPQLDIKFVNYIFKKHKDEKIQELLKELNMSYLNAHKELANDSSYLDVLKEINTYYILNKDEEIQQNVISLNKSYLDYCCEKENVYKLTFSKLIDINCYYKESKNVDFQNSLKNLNINYLNNLINNIVGVNEYLLQKINKFYQKDENTEIKKLVEKLNKKYISYNTCANCCFIY